MAASIPPGSLGRTVLCGEFPYGIEQGIRGLKQGSRWLRTGKAFEPSPTPPDVRCGRNYLRAGERGFLDLIGRYGRDTVLDAIRSIMQQSELRARTTRARFRAESTSPVIHG